MQWDAARVLLAGVLKGGPDCHLARLPLEGPWTCPLLEKIMLLVVA
jgi:hypothetical protein